jgi:hypothetical protein
MPANKTMLETLYINDTSSYLDHLNQTVINFDIKNESEIVQNSNSQRILNEFDFFFFVIIQINLVKMIFFLLKDSF